MKLVPKVFLDANVFKFATTEQQRLVPRRTSIQWGPKIFDMVVHDLKVLNPNDRIRNPELKSEAGLVEKLAAKAKSGQFKAVSHFEVTFETMGLPAMDCQRGRFYGAPVEQIKAPITYSRLFISGRHDPERLVRDFLEGLSDPRFDELQKITGAFQGDRPKNLNQLLDAFYLWCAEFELCDYFLTLDFKLIRIVTKAARRRKAPRLVRPSELLRALDNEAHSAKPR